MLEYEAVIDVIPSWSLRLCPDIKIAKFYDEPWFYVETGELVEEELLWPSFRAYEGFHGRQMHHVVLPGVLT